MDVSARTLKAIREIITGDIGKSPYRSGQRLVSLFNEYGFNDAYRQGFPSRWKYTEDRLRELNGTSSLDALICEVLDPREFMESDFNVEDACEYINKYINYENFEIVINRGKAKLRSTDGVIVNSELSFTRTGKDRHFFIDEQINKSETKIADGDYDGAITNARSLLEATLLELEKELDNDPPKYSGNLPQLYKRTQRLLNLDPSRSDIDGNLKQVLSGFFSVIHGISGLSNSMGDRHARSYKPAKHHATLAVNAAKTLANFLFETHQYQSRKPSD